MKFATHPRRDALSQVLLAVTLSSGIVVGAWPTAVAAESVDTELLLLVDSSRTGLRDGDFDDAMAGYANAMTSSDVLDAIASGATGRIAVSLVFYGNDSQEVGIPWMTIASAADAAAFASAVLSAERPTTNHSTPAPALDAATLSFGTETGNSDNGYTSAVQIIEVATSSRPVGGSPAATGAELQAARDDALAAGVDMINAITLGNPAAQLESYYSANVIGGETGGTPASATASMIDTNLEGVLASHLQTSIGSAALTSNTVPEPRIPLLLMFAAALPCLRARKRI